MDARDNEMTDDLSALAWVQDELRKSLETAHKSLRRFVKESEALSGSDVDAVDPSVLRQARQQLHQGVGALELVGLAAGAQLLRASEAAVQRLASKPKLLNAAAVESVEHASFALLDYLSRCLAGKPVSALALFPAYRKMQELAGADRVHPADLWLHDWQWRDLPAEPAVAPLEPDAGTRSYVEAQSLQVMRQSAKAAQRMSDLFAGLGAGAKDRQLATLWQLAAAFFEGQAHKMPPPDVYAKRVMSRLLAQLRICERGGHDVSERLPQDLLFFCAQAGTAADTGATPRLAAVRRVYGFAGKVGVDYEEARLGRFDPAWIAQARKRVAGAKDGWSAVAGGELHRLVGLAEQFALVADSLKRLYPSGDRLAEALLNAVQFTVTSGEAPSPELAMEVATAVLYLDASLEDGQFDHPEEAQRVQRLAQRIDAVRGGKPSDPLESWMEDLYRRVSDRQTMGSVVQELHASLSEVEKLIDQFFRSPTERTTLIPVPNQLSAMRGVLSVLGMDQASQAVVRMRDEVDGLIATEVDPQRAAQAGTFDRLAGNLGALGFLIDMLSVQPQLAKSLFVFDAAAGELRAVMGRQERTAPAVALESPEMAEARLVEQARDLAMSAAHPEVPIEQVSRDLERLSHEALVADQSVLAETMSTAQAALQHAQSDDQRQAVRDELAQVMADFVSTYTGAPLEPELPPAAPVPLLPAMAATAPGTTGLEDDAEMREIFLEEAREVIQGAHEALAALADEPDNIGELTTVRRAFHTLKGSARMVGLADFGEAAWSCEQLYNARLADAPAADEALRGLTGDVLSYLSDWVDAIADGRRAGHDSQVVRQAAETMRLHGRREALSQLATPVPLSSMVPELPSAEMLVLTPVPEVEPEVEPELPAVQEPAFDMPAADVQTLEFDAQSFGAEFELSAEVPVLPEATPQAAEVAEISLDLDLGRDVDPPVLVAEPVATLELHLPSEDVQAPADLPVEIDLSLPDAGTPGESLSAEAVELPQPVTDQPAIEQPVAEDEFVASNAAEDLPSEPLQAPAEEAGFFEQPEVVEAGQLEVEQTVSDAADSDQFKMVGPLRISIPLFNIYLNEADELSRRLCTELAEWSLELHRPVGDNAIAMAHSLAGNSATVGFTDLSQLARTLEHGLMRSQAIGRGDAEEAQLFIDAAEEIRRLLHQFAAGFLKQVPPELLQRLTAHEMQAAQRLQAMGAATDSDMMRLDSAHAELSAMDEEVLEDLADLQEPEALQRVDMVDEPSMATEAAPEAAVPAEPVPEADIPGSMEEASSAQMLSEEPGHAAAVDADLPVVDTVLPSEADTLSAAEVALQAETEPPLAAQPESTVDALPVEVPADTAMASEALPAALSELGQPELKTLTALPQIQGRTVTVRDDALDDEDDIDAVDAIDAELFPIFEEEGQELLPQLAARMREWGQRPGEASAATACMRTLHTLKGGARLAGAMRLGEMAHRLETAIEHLMHRGDVATADIEPLEGRVDALQLRFDALRSRDAQAYAEATAAVEATMREEAAPLMPEEPVAATPAEASPTAEATPPAEVPTQVAVPPADERPVVAVDRRPAVIDWSRFVAGSPRTRVPAERGAAAAAGHHASVRVRAPLLDRLVNHAGEVSITRSRIESDVGLMKNSLTDLTENLDRLRRQLRDIELQAETQITSRMEQAKAQSQAFDPLEFDRFTRFQELTRMMAESVNDVATVQRSLQRTLQSAEDELAAQARLTRDLQDDLLRTRMVEFEGLSERLYRVVRQAGKETGKQVRLDIVGGSIEVDRGVLDRMTGAFEHLLRNCVTHGIETPDARIAAGKDASGLIVVVLTQEGNEVGIEFRDDGAGLNLKRIRERGVLMGLLSPEAQPSEGDLANLIFTPGFSTAEKVTELAGRGIGMDVVRNEVNAMGGRIETATTVGQGTSFKLVLPLTTAVTQVVMVRCGDTTVAIPSTLIEIVRRSKPQEIEQAYASGQYAFGDRQLPFFWLGALLQSSARGTEAGRTLPVVVVRSAQQRIALHVDEVLGNQEVVVKNLGNQLSRMPGLAGMTLLASGAVALIYNPVALATLYGETAWRHMREAQREADRAHSAPTAQALVAEPAVQQAPLVLVVDDSLTVRRVTQRLLVREGYRVSLAKDGLEGLERLAEEKPAVVLSDIEMPRMDGFDLVRNMRSDDRWRGLPVIMITSRIAQKHRDYAAELGVDHYMGKPYSEEDLLALVSRYATAAMPA